MRDCTPLFTTLGGRHRACLQSIICTQSRAGRVPAADHEPGGRPPYLQAWPQSRARRVPAAQREPVWRFPYLKAWAQSRARRVPAAQREPVWRLVSQGLAAVTRQACASGK